MKNLSQVKNLSQCQSVSVSQKQLHFVSNEIRFMWLVIKDTRY